MFVFENTFCLIKLLKFETSSLVVKFVSSWPGSPAVVTDELKFKEVNIKLC